VDREKFISPFLPSELPGWNCPACKEGGLVAVKDSLLKAETIESKKAHAHPDWEPDWCTQRFSLFLRCSKCKEPVFVVGNVEPVEYQDDDLGWGITDALVPSFFEPPIPIIKITAKCPATVRDEINRACMLFWANPSSAATRIRSAIERMMDDQKIPKKRKTKNGKFIDLSLHTRIENFTKKYPEVGANLLAIKWLGNSGSHSDDLKADDMLDAFELLEHVLDEIYESKSTRIKKLTKAIIKKKGPVSKK
jgi:hypothetical protein